MSTTLVNILPNLRTKHITSFSCSVDMVTLFTSAIVRVELYDDNHYLVESICLPIKGDDYSNWNADDNYIINFVAKALEFTIEDGSTISASSSITTKQTCYTIDASGNVYLVTYDLPTIISNIFAVNPNPVMTPIPISISDFITDADGNMSGYSVNTSGNIVDSSNNIYNIPFIPFTSSFIGDASGNIYTATYKPSKYSIMNTILSVNDDITTIPIVIEGFKEENGITTGFDVDLSGNVIDANGNIYNIPQVSQVINTSIDEPIYQYGFVCDSSFTIYSVKTDNTKPINNLFTDPSNILHDISSVPLLVLGLFSVPGMQRTSGYDIDNSGNIIDVLGSVYNSVSESEYNAYIALNNPPVVEPEVVEVILPPIVVPEVAEYVLPPIVVPEVAQDVQSEPTINILDSSNNTPSSETY